jgi:hypothetical protein
LISEKGFPKQALSHSRPGWDRLPRDGYPFVTSVAYSWDGESISFTVQARAEFLASIRSNPKVGVSITVENNESPRVLLLGEASVVCGSDDGPAWDEWKVRWHSR